MDVSITNFDDAPSNTHRKPEAGLLSHEGENKKYLQACLEQRRRFTPFVVACDGVLGQEAKTVLRNLEGQEKIRKLFQNNKRHEGKAEL